MKKLLLLLSFLWLATSCSPTAKPINYGSDMCDFCKMNIVDHQHAAEAVTSKAKVYKFDAIECMVDFIEKKPEVDFPLQLVADFSQPGSLVNADECQFLICEKIPSPMGAFLSAFHNESQAKKTQQSKGGKLFTWVDLQKHFRESRVAAN